MSFKRDRYLVLDPCGNYLVRITVPAYMRSLFGNKRYFVKSTGTSDIRQARLFRDAIAVEWIRLREQVKPREGSKIEQAIAELRRVSARVHETPVQHVMSNTQSQGVPSLLKMRDLYLLQFSEKRKLTTLSKTNKAVEVLLEHLKKRDVQLAELLNYVREGDTLIVIAIDRLGRNTIDVLSTVEMLQMKGVKVVSLREGFDLSTPVGKAMLTMMAGLASLEKDLIAERRAAGIKRAQSEGKHCGRPIKATVEQVRELLARGLPPAAVQDRLEISKATFYRLKSFLQLPDI